jgi:Na+/melibiose symporter-like transporter
MLLFGVGSFGTGLYLTVPSVLLLFFMTDVLGHRRVRAACL